MKQWRKRAFLVGWAGVLAGFAVSLLPWGGPDARPPSEVRPAAARMLAGRVGARGVESWPLRFAGGRPSRVEVLPGGAARLECSVEDAAGRVQGARGWEGNTCLVRWTPPRTGMYRVVVRNPGRAAIAYHLFAY